MTESPRRCRSCRPCRWHYRRRLADRVARNTRGPSGHHPVVRCRGADLQGDRLRLKIPIGTVMSRLHRGRAMLRHQLVSWAGSVPGRLGRGRMTMECREVRQLAEAFISEQLLVETTHAIVAHLERCPACRAEVAGLRRLQAASRSAFANAPDLAARPEFISSLSARLQAEATRQRPTRWTAWLGMAASLFLVLGLVFGVREWSMSNLSALLHAAVGDHRFCALDFKLAEPPITLEEAARRFDPVNAGWRASSPRRPHSAADRCGFSSGTPAYSKVAALPTSCWPTRPGGVAAGHDG